MGQAEGTDRSASWRKRQWGSGLRAQRAERRASGEVEVKTKFEVKVKG